jgi:thiosulfate/3-mercaptopyruvate sulfurtransferase
MNSRPIVRLGMTMLLVTLASQFAQAQSPTANASAAMPPGSALPIPQTLLIQPDALNHLLQTPGAEKPLVLQVGSHVLYAQAHIPGSEYAGPGSQSTGLEVLASRVASIPHKSFIVIYCGCCPWNHCPNIAPALARLQEMGFTNVKVLYLADNFGTNWVSKGYPVEQGR